MREPTTRLVTIYINIKQEPNINHFILRKELLNMLRVPTMDDLVTLYAFRKDVFLNTGLDLTHVKVNAIMKTKSQVLRFIDIPEEIIGRKISPLRLHVQYIARAAREFRIDDYTGIEHLAKCIADQFVDEYEVCWAPKEVLEIEDKKQREKQKEKYTCMIPVTLDEIKVELFRTVTTEQHRFFQKDIPAMWKKINIKDARGKKRKGDNAQWTIRLEEIGDTLTKSGKLTEEYIWKYGSGLVDPKNYCFMKPNETPELTYGQACYLYNSEPVGLAPIKLK